MSLEKSVTALNILAMLLAASAFYFSDASSIKERIAVAETRMQQETAGYYSLQMALGQRLDRLERKIDCLADRRMCGTHQ